jgi:hypothetical protein
VNAYVRAFIHIVILKIVSLIFHFSFLFIYMAIFMIYLVFSYM